MPVSELSGPSLRLVPEVSGVLADGAGAAYAALRDARAGLSLEEQTGLAETVGIGADGTPTMRVDELVEGAVLDQLSRHGVNVLSEEAGLIDRGSARTLVVDPLDGSANAAAGVPLSAFSAVIAEDGRFTEALTVWLDTGQWWWARDSGESLAEVGGGRRPLRTSRRQGLRGGALSMLRPHTAQPTSAAAWWAAAEIAHRVRILSSSCLEIGLVCVGATDAFADAASDTHRLMDVAAGVVLAEAAGGAMVDVFGRPIELDADLSRRWSGVCGSTVALAEELVGVMASAADTTSGRHH